MKLLELMEKLNDGLICETNGKLKCLLDLTLSISNEIAMITSKMQ